MTTPDQPPPPVATAADAPLAAYLLAEPFLAGKVVLDVGPRPPRAAERLARAGASEVQMADGPGPAFDAADASVDVLMCVARLAAPAGDAERHRWLMEIRRVLRPGGFCLLRLSAAALSARGPATPADALHDLLRPHFGAIQVVAEAPLAGLSFVVPELDDVAVNEQLAPIAGEPTHLVALCAPPPAVPGELQAHPWQLPESLLVPLRPAGATPVAAGAEELAALRDELDDLRARLEAATLERDALREALMIAQDRTDRHEAALSTLRRQTERHLHQLTDAAAEVELARLDRDREQRRADALATELAERVARP